MSMIGHFQAITGEQLQRLLSNAIRVEAILYADDAEAHALDIDKSWDAIHYVLNKAPSHNEGEFAKLILGGQEIGDDLGCGPAHYLTQDEVQKLSQSLQSYSDQQFKAAFKPQELDAAQVYPQIWVRDGDAGLEYVLTYFRDLRTFFADAAANAYAMLVYIN